jgi:hypothetical protein
LIMTTKISSDNIQLTALQSLSGGASTTVYNIIAELPLSDNDIGDRAFVRENNRLYLWNGVGWFNIALINTSPTITQGPELVYALPRDGTPVVVNLSASDPEGVPITWSSQVTSGTLGNTAVITQSNNVFTITPSTSEDDIGEFTITFTASDGINIDTAASIFSLQFAVGQIIFPNPGMYQFTAPSSFISVVCVGGGGCGDDGNTDDGGGGGGGGGALAFINNLPVSVGDVCTVVVGAGGSNGGGRTLKGSVSAVRAQSGGNTSFAVGGFSMVAEGGQGGAPYLLGTGTANNTAQGGAFNFSNTPSNNTITTGGGAGGGGGAPWDGGAGGGGAGGYDGRGGNGSGGLSTTPFTSGFDAVGVGGGGGGAGFSGPGLGNSGGGNGGAGLVTSGQSTTGGGGGGANIFSTQFPAQNGLAGNLTGGSTSRGGNGGFPGGGGGGSYEFTTVAPAVGANGAVRIIWGANRTFTSTATDVIDVQPPSSKWVHPPHQARIVSSDIESGDRFGNSISISNNTVVVGAPNEAPSSILNAGSAYVFIKTGTMWSQQDKITAGSGQTQSGALFGSSVAISNNTIVIGAYQDTQGTPVNTGAAHVYVRSGNTWTKQATLLASDRADGDRFGISVAIDGDTIVVGSSGDDFLGLDQPGSVYVFTRTGTTWNQQAKLTAEADAQVQAFFGASVSISGNTVAIGAWGHDVINPTSISAVGAVFVFARTETTWSRQAMLMSPSPVENARLGWSVSINGDDIVAGAPGFNIAGTAHVFARVGTTWNHQATISPPIGDTETLFAQSVVMGEGVVAVGSTNRDSRVGGAYLYARDPGFNTWELKSTLLPNPYPIPSGAATEFGCSVSISTNAIAIGSLFEVSGQGRAHIFVSN